MLHRQDNLSPLFLIWCGLLLLSTASGHLHSPDGEINYRTTRSLATGQGYAIPPLPDGSMTRRAEDGKEYAQYGPLQPLLAVPFYLTGKMLARVIPESWLSAQAARLESTVSFYRGSSEKWGGDFEGLYPKGHQERVCRAFVSLFNPAVTGLTLWLLLAWSLRFYEKTLPGLLLPGVYILATYAWPHSRPFYTEVLATFFVLGASFLAATPRKEKTVPIPPAKRGGNRGFVAQAGGIGVLTGLAVLARLDSVVATLGLAWIACHRIWIADRDSTHATRFQATLAGVVCFLLLVSILPVQNLLRYGSPLATGYSDQPEGVKFSIPFFHALWIYLLSPGKGVFWYSPPLIAALFAWPLFFRRDRHLAIGIGLMVLGYVLVVGRWQNLGGWCWGPRHLFQITPLLLFPLPFLFAGGASCPHPRPFSQGEKGEENSPSGGGSDEGPGEEKQGWGTSLSFPRAVLGVTFLMGFFVQICGVLVDFMWPLDRSLRGLPPGQDTEKILSIGFYGPILHLESWRLDREPDWLLADLWKSGQVGAQLLALAVWLSLATVTFLLGWAIYRQVATGRDA